MSFLAHVCIEALYKHIKEKDLLKISFIEATIPFRDAKKMGKDPLQNIRDRCQI